MSATATAEPIARNSAVRHIDFADGKPDVGILRTRPAYPEELTEEERARLWVASKDDDDFTAKAITYGKLTGDFAIDRHILPQHTGAEIDAAILRIQEEHPERYGTQNHQK